MKTKNDLQSGDTVIVKDRLYALVYAKSRRLVQTYGVPRLFTTRKAARLAKKTEPGSTVIRLNDVSGVVE